MTAVLSTEASSAARPSSPLKAVPVAVWAVMGAFALATAGLGGALLARSGDAPAVVASQTAEAPPVQPRADPAPLAPVQPVQQLAPTQAAPVQQAQPAPVRPKPAPRPVQHAAAPTPAPVAAPAPQVVQAPVQQPVYTPVETTRAAICASCGTVESVHAIQEQGQGTGLGAVAGGIAGGLLGNQVGGGNGKKVMTVLGAVGGGLAGHEVEKRARAVTAYDVRVRMEDGSVRTFRRSEPVQPGTRVTVEGSNFRVGGGSSNSGGGVPARPIYTSS